MIRIDRQSISSVDSYWKDKVAISDRNKPNLFVLVGYGLHVCLKIYELCYTFLLTKVVVVSSFLNSNLSIRNFKNEMKLFSSNKRKRYCKSS